MAYTISVVDGVRQDHKGRLYQIGRYPNGKTIMVPYVGSEVTRRHVLRLSHLWTIAPGYMSVKPCQAWETRRKCSVCEKYREEVVG